MARRIHKPKEPHLDLDRARAWLYAARTYSVRANEDDAIVRESFKIADKVLRIWRDGERRGRVPEAVEKAREMLLDHGCRGTIKTADAHSEDPARVPSSEVVAALLQQVGR